MILSFEKYYYFLPYFDEGFNNLNYLNNNDLFSTSLLSSINNVDETFESIKYLNNLFSSTLKNKLFNNSAFVFPIRSIFVFDMFRSDFEDFS